MTEIMPKLSIAIIGATGYTGGELLRLLGEGMLGRRTRVLRMRGWRTRGVGTRVRAMVTAWVRRRAA